VTERNQVWRAARPHLAPYGHFVRIESSTDVGIPDLFYTVGGHSGWIENKMFSHEGRAPSHLTLEQILWGEEEVRAGGSWHLFGKCDNIWLLYDVYNARILLEGGTPSPTFRVVGGFPLQELLGVIIAPR